MEMLISVVIPVYNATRFISEAIESVLAQTYSNFELIIVDDCSTDNSVKIAQHYAQLDNRIKVIACEKNQGVALTRNTGIDEAKGNYIALLDSDDVWHKTKLEKQVAFLEQMNAPIIYCSYDFIDEHSNSVLKPYIVPVKTDYSKMLAENVIGCSTVFVESALLKANKFSRDFYHEDYALWMRILKKGITAFGISDILVHYRKVNGSRSDNKWNAAKQRWQIYRNELNMSLLQSLQGFIRYTLHGVSKHYLK